jgi:arylsulfatase A-like enzyme
MIRYLLVLAFAVLALHASAAARDAAPAPRTWSGHQKNAALPEISSRPNFLWIIAEDMGPEFGAYATAGVRTPNVDKLSREGVRYTHAFTTSPVCSTSRSAFHTGMYQMSIGAHNHRSHRPDDPSPYPWPLPEGVRVVTDWLRHAGYFTANVEVLPDDVPFRGTGKTDWNFTYRGEPFDTGAWDELKDNQPFFAEINFPESHRGADWNTAHERIDQPANPEAVEIPPYYPDHPVIRSDWAQYLNAVMAFDEKVGVMLDLGSSTAAATGATRRWT